jgi:hypothetical protein
MKNEELDPEGKPIGRPMRQQDEVSETSAGVTPTSPSPLSGKPSALKLDQVNDPGAVNAPRVAVESSKSPRGDGIPEWKPPVGSRLPEVITAREVFEDDSNCDGRVSGRVQR